MLRELLLFQHESAGRVREETASYLIASRIPPGPAQLLGRTGKAPNGNVTRNLPLKDGGKKAGGFRA